MKLFHQQKTIGIITIASGIGALACLLAGVIGVNYNLDAFSNPLLMLSIPQVGLQAIKWFMIFDMLGYYLLLLPVIYLLHDWLSDKTPWYRLITFSGSAYVLIGAIGAAILAVVWPHIIAAYPGAPPGMQTILQANFTAFNDMVNGGLWNLLETLFAGTWWLWTGILFYQRGFKKMGVLTCLTGASCLADSVAGMFQWPVLQEVSLNCYLLLAIVWAIAFGVFLLKKPLQQ